MASGSSARACATSPAAYLSAIDRGGETLVAVGPEQVLRGYNRLVFVGVVESVVDLQRVRGWCPRRIRWSKFTASKVQTTAGRGRRQRDESACRPSNRDGQIRNRYDAAVIAVYRNAAASQDASAISCCRRHAAAAGAQVGSPSASAPRFFLVLHIDSSPARAPREGVDCDRHHGVDGPARVVRGAHGNWHLPRGAARCGVHGPDGCL